VKAFGSLFIADLKQFFRERTALFFTFAFPILFMVIFGFVFSGDDDVNYDIGLVDQDNSSASGQIAEALRQVPIFTVITEGSLEDDLNNLRRGDLDAVVLIPQGLQTNISAGQVTGLTVYYDPSDTTSAPIILSVLNEIVNVINRQLTNSPVLVELDQQSVQVRNLRNIDYLVPGILAMSILFLGLFGSLTLVDWRERKILKRFGATPITHSTMIYSQVSYRLVLALLQALIIVLVARFAFGVTVLGNWFVLFGLILLGTLTFISLGYFIVSRVKTMEGAMPIIQLVQFPMLFLSGIFFPVDFMPDFMRPIIAIMPLTYLGDAMRQVMVEATPVYPLWVDVAVLGGWMIVSMFLAIWLFRWE
jgi:ABC-2 type transport system permease protein